MEKLTEKEINDRLQQLEGWTFEDGSITKSYTFEDFKQAFSAMTHIAFEAEALNHHPDWSNVYNSLTVKLNTHDVGGITENDFQLALKIEAIVGKS